MKSYEMGFVNDTFEKEKEKENANVQEKTPEGAMEGENADSSSHFKYSEEGMAAAESRQSSKSSPFLKISKTIMITFSLIPLAMAQEVTGPSMEYLEDLIGGTTEDVSEVLIARGVGLLMGSLIAGYLCMRFSHLDDLFHGVCCVLAGVSTIVAPFCSDRVLLGFMLFLTGTALGYMYTGCTAVALKLWGGESGTPLVAQHMTFGIGASLVSQVVNGFIKDGIAATVAPYPVSTENYIASTFLDPTTPRNPADFSDVKYAYVLVGALPLVFAVLYFIYFFVDEQSKEESNPVLNFREMLHPGSCTNGSTLFGVGFFTLYFVMYLHVVGGMMIFSVLLFKFSTDQMDFSETQAANINTLFWVAFTTSRVITALVVHFLSPVVIMVAVVALNVVNGLCFAIWGAEVTTLFWVITASFGVSIAPLYSMVMWWANLYVEINAVGVALANVGGPIGNIVYQYLGGYLFDEVGPHSLMYVVLSSSLSIALCYIILQTLATKRGRRLTTKPTACVENDDGIVVMTITKY